MSWANVPCHPTVRKIVTRAILSGRFGRTSLVFGPQGAGQEDVARAIAMTFICLSVEGDFCGMCPNCRRIQEGIYPDVMEMHPWENWGDPESKAKLEKEEKLEKSGKQKRRKKNIYKINHMRIAQELAMHLPYEGDLKFFIIHDAHCMEAPTANSLLKILEEPHPHTRFILLTDQPAGILPTIRSRCWAIRLIPLEIEALAQSLQGELSPEQAITIARTAGGLPERARSLIEEGYLERRDWLLDLLMQVRQRESAVGVSGEEIARNRDDLSGNLDILLRIVRDGLVAVSCSGSTQYENQDRSADLQRLWQNARANRLIDSMKDILDALEDSERFVNPSIMMMDILLRLRLAITA